MLQKDKKCIEYYIERDVVLKFVDQLQKKGYELDESVEHLKDQEKKWSEEYD